MEIGDKVLFYHSVSAKAVVGIAEITRTAFADSTGQENKWIAVEIKPFEKFGRAVSLSEIKNHPALVAIAPVKQSRLSVLPLSKTEFQTILSLTKN